MNKYLSLLPQFKKILSKKQMKSLESRVNNVLLEIEDDIADEIVQFLPKPTPKTKTRHIGVEFEFYSETSYTQVLGQLLKSNLLSQCNLGDDSSIDPPYGKSYTTYELRVLMKEKNFEATMKKLDKFFKKIGAKTNSSCGLHVHLDMRYRDHERAFNNLFKCQNLLYKMVHKNRVSNTYCVPARYEDTSKFNYTTAAYKTEKVLRAGKHSGLNYQSAINEHKTIEIRIHHGTVDCTRVTKWINLLLSIINRGKMTKEVEQPEDLSLSKKEKEKIQKYLKKYYRKAS